MIRKWDAKETRPLLTLWLESTIHAHPFINETYWHESVAVVRDVYLPAASTWVWEENATIKGFVSVMESRFIGALFVAPDAIRRGIGSALLAQAESALFAQHPRAWLETAANSRAAALYRARGWGDAQDIGDGDVRLHKARPAA